MGLSINNNKHMTAWLRIYIYFSELFPCQESFSTRVVSVSMFKIKKSLREKLCGRKDFVQNWARYYHLRKSLVFEGKDRKRKASIFTTVS